MGKFATLNSQSPWCETTTGWSRNDNNVINRRGSVSRLTNTVARRYCDFVTPEELAALTRAEVAHLTKRANDREMRNKYLSKKDREAIDQEVIAEFGKINVSCDDSPDRRRRLARAEAWFNDQ